jgi:signal transduction histidine kinase
MDVVRRDPDKRPLSDCPWSDRCAPSADRAPRSAPALLVGVAGVVVTGGWLIAAGVRRRAASRQDARVKQVRVEGEQTRRRFVQRLDHELKNPLPRC